MNINEQKPPPDWGKDLLSEKLNLFQKNEYNVFVSQKPIYSVFQRVETLYIKISGEMTNFSDEKYIVASLFLKMAHGAYLGSVRLLFGGQLAPAYMVARGCLENTLYGIYIFEKPELAKIWLKRNTSKEDKEKHFANFKSHKKMFKILAKALPKIGQEISDLYNHSIEFGGHPNPDALLSDLESVNKERGEYFFYYATDVKKDPNPFILCLNAIIKTGALGLGVFRYIFKEKYEKLGISNELDELLEIEIPLQQSEVNNG